MIVRIVHETRLAYAGSAYESHNEVRLAPVDGPGQRCLEFRLTTEPDAAILEYRDAFGNRVHAVSVHPPHAELAIVAESVVERVETPPGRGRDLTFAEFLAEDEAHVQEHHEFLAASHYIPFGDRLRRFFWQARPAATEGVGEYTNRMVAYVRDQFEYEAGRTSVTSTVDDILGSGAGVCQDFAHLTIGILRLAGVPARYVSGYLAPRPAAGTAASPLGQATHAWIEALLPGTGWTGFDPTHRGGVELQHVRIGVGRDYADVPPLKGVFRGHGQTQSMGVDVRIDELNAWSAGPGAEQ